jgi:hypothetical protein
MFCVLTKVPRYERLLFHESILREAAKDSYAVMTQNRATLLLALLLAV